MNDSNERSYCAPYFSVHVSENGTVWRVTERPSERKTSLRKSKNSFMKAVKARGQRTWRLCQQIFERDSSIRMCS